MEYEWKPRAIEVKFHPPLERINVITLSLLLRDVRNLLRSL